MQKRSESDLKCYRLSLRQQRWAQIYDNGVSEEWVGVVEDMSPAEFQHKLQRLVLFKNERQERNANTNDRLYDCDRP